MFENVSSMISKMLLKIQQKNSVLSSNEVDLLRYST